MEIQSRSVSKKPVKVIMAPMTAAFIDIQKAGVFNEKIRLTPFGFMDESTSILKKVGPAGAAVLATHKIKTVRDLVETGNRALIGLEPRIAKAAYAAKNVIIAAFQKYGVEIKERDAGMVTTMAVAMDPATGISYNT
jgi:hypothetical protein